MCDGAGDATGVFASRDLGIAEVTFDLMFVSRDDDDDDSAKPVLTLHGVAALAIARIVPSKERAKGYADAEILIDRDRYNDLPDLRKDALLDHELQHFMVQRDKDLQIKTDDQHRPRLKLRPHDYDFGWFECVARRYGMDSVEVQQAKMMWEENGQVLFSFVGGSRRDAETLRG